MSTSTNSIVVLSSVAKHRTTLMFLAWILVASFSTICCEAFVASSPTRSVVRDMRQQSQDPVFVSRSVDSFPTPTGTMELENTEDEDDDDKDDTSVDYGEKVAGIFANMRIPASLIAGAALGSAFGMPMAETDGLKMGMVKRLYTMVMLGTLSSMLLTVLLSTMCVGDIALNPPRKAKYVKDYIDKHYALEWMLMKTHFMWGNIVFVLGSMLRGWVFLKCPIIGDGVLGIMGSLMLVSISILVEFNRKQTGDVAFHQWRKNISLIRNRAKTNRLFGVAVISWLATLAFVIVKSPYVYRQLTSP